ncbi:Lipin/Ned1/Smp2-domain-containing protein [Cladochytrium replicatum]|nr:Lipin/Ned1/Smp2-domain-containing protein [Cladochytrium replicatum]
MKLGDAGEAFFVVETDNPVPSEYATSPIPKPEPDVVSEANPLELLELGEAEDVPSGVGGYVSAPASDIAPEDFPYDELDPSTELPSDIPLQLNLVPDDPTQSNHVPAESAIGSEKPAAFKVVALVDKLSDPPQESSLDPTDSKLLFQTTQQYPIATEAPPGRPPLSFPDATPISEDEDALMVTPAVSSSNIPALPTSSINYTSALQTAIDISEETDPISDELPPHASDVVALAIEGGTDDEEVLFGAPADLALESEEFGGRFVEIPGGEGVPGMAISQSLPGHSTLSGFRQSEYLGIPPRRIRSSSVEVFGSSAPEKEITTLSPPGDDEGYPFSDTEVELPNKAIRGPASDPDLSFQDPTKRTTKSSSATSIWSWTWGALPVVSGRGSKQPTEAVPTPPPAELTETMTVDEKVDSYLASIREDAKVTEEAEAEDVTVGEVKIEMSSCGFKEISKLGGEAAEDLFRKHLVPYESYIENPAIVMDPNMVFFVNGGYHNWTTAAPMVFAAALYNKKLPSQSMKKLIKTEEEQRGRGGWGLWWGSSSPSGTVRKLDESKPDTPTTPLPSKPSTPAPLASPPLSPPPPTPTQPPQSNYVKSLRLTSDQLRMLNLHQGCNTISFSVQSRLQGTATTSARIFLWRHDARVVISDVDGTITKSDVLGHVFTMVGRDWTHIGVASLYTNIRKNGYEIMYLTARALGQAESTRDYLKKVQQAKAQLPEGPVIMSPDRLFRALHREVVMRKPEEFKIACLRDIKRLWGDEWNPFYAGFGNRITDALSYRSVDVPASRIFTIDPSGEVKLELMADYKSSYIKLNDIVDQIFPPLGKALDTEFNDFHFWRPPLPEVAASTLSAGATPPAGSSAATAGSSDEEYEDDDEEYDDEEEEEDFEGTGGDEDAVAAQIVHEVMSAPYL